VTRRRIPTWLGYLGAAALVVGTTAVGAATRAVLDVPDVEMLYVVAVLVSAVFLGRGPAVAAAAVGVLAYDYLFVPPVFTLNVADGRYLFTFAMMFAIGLLVSSLADRAREAAVRAESETLRGTLLSSVSHDLRTPLASITGAATTLRDQAVDEATRRELVGAICEEAERMERMVSNLLDLTRLAAGAVAIHQQWIPVEEIVGVSLARTEAALAGHRVRTDLAGASAMILADPILMEQLLVNLLENAARHTPRGTEVLVRASVGPGGLDLEVADRGPGVPHGEEERVFERFHRGGRAAGGGAGLGLAIARAIAEVHGGSLRASAREGGGASFRLHLPASGAAPAVPVEPEVTAAGRPHGEAP
jgi:two-component system, OmpR family, sensor histidine kinase KdpD